MEIVNYLDLSLLTGSFDDVADWLVDRASTNGLTPIVVSHINVANYYHMEKHPETKRELKRGCVLVLDGIGMKLGGVILGRGWLPDVNGTDLFPRVMRRAAHRRLRIFCLGAERSIMQRSVDSIQKQYSGANIVGFDSGYFDAAEEAAIVSGITESGAQMLLVGMGFLRQERFSLEYCDHLGVSVIWNVGGLFDFISGAKLRAPLVVRKARLEWLFRFLREPRRMWHRNLVAAPWFLTHLLDARRRRTAVPTGHESADEQPVEHRREGSRELPQGDETQN
jgi:exopolysaccharide biosynthesis WecB/TagA/CpsF family protein